MIIVSDDITTFANDIFSWDDESRYLGSGAGATYKTPIGPISIFLGSRLDIWNPIWYFNIGYTF
jgi:outer membrane translocation and assembly module TamA